MKKKKKSKKFIRGFLIYVTVLSALMVAGLVLLWVNLAKFQRSSETSDVKVSETFKEEVSYDPEEKRTQEAFETFVNTSDTKTWIKTAYDDAQAMDKESLQELKAFVEDNIMNTSRSLYKAEDYTIAEPVYLVYNGDKPVARICLAKNNDSYVVEGVTIFAKGKNSIEVIFPKEATLTVGGEIIDSSLCEEKELTEPEGYISSLSNAHEFLVYREDGLIAPPSIEVEGGNGTIIRACDNNYYYVHEDEADLPQRADGFVKALLHYYAMGKENVSGNMMSVLNLVASGSKASETIHQSQDGVIWRYADHDVKYETTVSKVYELAPDCVFVDVSYTATGSKDENLTESETYRVYFVNNDNGFKIVDFSLAG